MTVAAALHARLRAALPEQVPVLPPEDIQKINAGGKPGQPAGLASYLKAHPEGWVVVEEPVPISSDGTTAVFWVAVASVAGTAAEAAALAARVAHALGGTPYEPGPHTEVTPAGPSLLDPRVPGVWAVRPTYDALTIAGTPQ